jgi:hypothetical protein
MLNPLRTALEAADVLAARREMDGLFQKVWFPNQCAGFESAKSEVWAFGGNRSGKTEWLMGLAATYARFGVFDPRLVALVGVALPAFTPKRIWVVSLDRDMSRNILQAKLFHNGATLATQDVMIPDEEIEDWNITNQTCKLRNGSILIFKTGESGPLAFQGADVDLICFDEVPEEVVYTESTLRVGAGRRLWIRGAATILPPPGVPGGIRWIYNRKVKPWIECGGNVKSPHMDIFTLRLTDNPHLLQEEKDRLTAMYPPGSAEFRIRILGELLPTIGGSPVYAAYDRQYHENYELAPMVDGTRRPKVDPHLPLVLTMDFNPSNGVWLVGQRVNRMFRVVDEICMERSDIASMTAEFRSRFPTHGAELWIYGDTTGRREEVQTSQSNFHVFQSYMTGYPVPIRYHLPSTNPPVPERVAAVNLALRPEDGSKQFEHAPHCENLRDDLEGSKWKPNGKIDKIGGRRSDGADALGYWISTVQPTVTLGQMRQAALKSIKSPQYISNVKGGTFPASYRGVRSRLGVRNGFAGNG